MTDGKEIITAVEYTTMGAGVGLMNVEQILSIIFLCISVIAGIINIIITLRRTLADKKIEPEERAEIQSQLTTLQQDLKSAINQLTNEPKGNEHESD